MRSLTAALLFAASLAAQADGLPAIDDPAAEANAASQATLAACTMDDPGVDECFSRISASAAK